MEAPVVHRSKLLILRNTLITVGSQVLGTPLAVFVSAVTARYLGAADFGQMYVAWMIVCFGFLLVEWGQGGVLPATIAQDRSVAGSLLGTALTWRLIATFVTYGVLAFGCWLLHYSHDFQVILALVVLQCGFQSLSNGCQDAIRGFERTDIGAYAQVGMQLLTLFIVVPTVVLGGQVRGVLLAQAAASAIVLIFVFSALRRVGVGRLRVDWETVKSLALRGRPFLVLGFAMTLQPNIDAVMLSKLSPETVVGWHAVTRRLIMPLILPAALLIGAMYPTLSRLYAEDKAQYVDTARASMRGTTLLAVPVALACGLYNDVGIAIFSKAGYSRAGENLQVMAVFLFLLYFSMPLGTSIMAAGRQKAWAVAQFVCVLVSAVLDPILIPWFQRHNGNGGLGVCVAAVISEVLMVASGWWIAERGIFDRALGLNLLRTLGAGAIMFVVARLLGFLNSFIAAPIALLSYAGGLWVLGGLGRDQIESLRQAMGPKFAKFARD
ncbi:MAG TPA: flippase [Polyangiaceae bacterium]|nr:flippase [Polyangiaceae bacterium]